MAKKKKIKKPAKSVVKRAVKKAGKKPAPKKYSKKSKKVSKVSPKKTVSKVKGKPKKVIAKPKAPKKLTPAQAVNEKRKRGVNRYNAIRSAISDSFTEQSKKITNAEIKEIYAWIKEKHGDSPTSQIIANIDVLIAQYYERLGETKIDLSLFSPYVEWFYFKETLHDESSLHKPNDLIRVDLSFLSIDWIDFLAEDYLIGGEQTRETIKVALTEVGVLRKSPVPMIALTDAFFDAGIGSNVYIYKFIAEKEFMDIEVGIEPSTPPPIDLVKTPEGVEKPKITEAVTTKTQKPSEVTPYAGAPTTEQIQSAERIRMKELENERDKEIRLEKIAEREKVRKEFLQLFKDKDITLKEYTDAIKELGLDK